MVATVLLVIGLSLSGFIWLLALQLRVLYFHTLYLNAHPAFPYMEGSLLRRKIAASAHGGGGAVGALLRAHCNKALNHYKLTRRAMWQAPILALGVVLVWRFISGGG